MGKKIILSGMRPTGKLHLGHWVGALSNWVKLQEEYKEMQKSEKAGLYSTMLPIVASITGMVTLIISMFGFTKTTQFNEILKGIDNNIWISTIMAFMVGIFTISFVRFFNRRKQLSSKNEFRKEILMDRLKELEKLKHSDIEKILRRNRNNL